MLKIKLIAEEIVKYLPTEEDIQDDGYETGWYAICALKGLVKSLQQGYIEVNKIDAHNQAWSSEFGIWFQKHQYKEIIN